MSDKREKKESKDFKNGNRQDERINHRVSIGYSPEPYDPSSNKTPQPHWFGSLQNISQLGICFDANGDFEMGQVISLFLKLSDSSNGITMLGKIKWIEEMGDSDISSGWKKARLGVRFIGALPADWQRIIPTESQQQIPPE